MACVDSVSGCSHAAGRDGRFSAAGGYSQHAPGLALFRADGSPGRGLGHITRSLVLAAELRSRGWTVRYVTRDFTPGGADLLPNAGVELRLLPEWATHAADLSFTLEQARGAALIVTDGYFADAEYQETLVTGTGAVVAAIDDSAGVPVTAHFLINGSLHAAPAAYQAPPRTTLLLGPRFALVRSEFARARPPAPVTRERPRSLLVTMGGSDPVDFTARAATWLADRFPGLGLTLLLGPAYRNEHALRAAFHGQRRIEIVRSPASILPLFQSADLILTSGGTTVWDLCCLGKPFAAVAIADVQRHLVQRLGQAGAALDLGWHEQLSADSLAAALEPLLGVAARRRLALAAFALVDGKGAARVADALEWRCGPPTSSDLSEECR